MMKKIILSGVLVLSLQYGHSQTFAEWFKQKKTQIKYLINQIAALQVYTNYLEKGYSIVQQGTHVISDIKHGDFDLHNDYFNSLKSVNPSVRNSSRVAVILTDQADILKLFNQLLAGCNESGQFTDKEMVYIRSVYTSMILQSASTLDELLAVITSGNLEMKDDERIAKIESIYKDIGDKYSFTQAFCKETSLLAVQRMMEATEVQTSRKLFGIQ